MENSENIISHRDDLEEMVPSPEPVDQKHNVGADVIIESTENKNNNWLLIGGLLALAYLALN